MEIEISKDMINKRADVLVLEYLRKNGYRLISRSTLRKFWDKIVSVEGKIIKPSLKLKEDNSINVNLEKLDEEIREDIERLSILPQKGELDVIFEDKDCLVINKRSGVVVHPGVANPVNTLANYVVDYLSRKGEYNSSLKRGGIVHRLDKGVSGLIIFAKQPESQIFFQKQFQDHKVNKVYLAKVEYSKMNENLFGLLGSEKKSVKEVLDSLEKNSFVCDTGWLRLEGYIHRSLLNRIKMRFDSTKKDSTSKYSLSYIKPLSENELLIKIETGRMHQIRASLEYLGINIVGDTLYSTKSGKGGVPDSIELESVLLSLPNLENKIMTFRLK